MKKAKLTYISFFAAVLFTLSCSFASWAQNGRERQTDSSNCGERPEAKGGLKITGYIQTQFQWGQQEASLGVGAPNENPSEPFSRIGIRRGRLKFSYTHTMASAVLQLDATEKGVGLKDAYINVTDPWLGVFSLRSGVFDRPFGFEIMHSSSRRESPERSRIFRTLFPNERDLGAMVSAKIGTGSVRNRLEVHAGLFAGNGIKQDNDSRKDFIGRISFDADSEILSLGAGISGYHGFVYMGTDNLYTMRNGGFVRNETTAGKGRYVRRAYMGFDARITFKTALGTTTLRGEYIFGRQPGTALSSGSPNSSSLPPSDTYIRPFGGGYALIVHDIVRTPLSLVAKYDWYDPNIRTSGNSIGLNGTGIADTRISTLGVGAAWNVTQALKLLAYYDIVRNETSFNIPEINSDLKDNVFTLRLQYKF